MDKEVDYSNLKRFVNFKNKYSNKDLVSLNICTEDELRGLRFQAQAESNTLSML